MATIDVRTTKDEDITKIVFSDYIGYGEDVVSLEIDREDVRTGCMGIVSNDEDYCALTIRNKEHALNMIKALNKAIELGWVV